MRWLRASLIGVMALAAVPSLALAETALPAHPTHIDPGLDPCRHFGTGESQVAMTIVNRLEGTEVELTIPIRYLEDRWDRQQNARHEAQLFRVTLDTFEPVSRHEAGEQNKRGIQNRMSILIADVVPMEALAALSMDSASPGTPWEPFVAYSSRPGPHGLREVTPLSDRITRDVYVASSSDEELETILSCSVVGSVLSPGCHHRFRAEGLDIKATYRRTELPNWSILERNMRRFLSCAASSN